MKDNMNSSTTSKELTLVLGGTGKTGRRVVERLLSRGVPTRIASRTTNPSFDWDDPSTWDATVNGVTAAYISYAPDLAIPGATDTIRAFVERAVERGVQRLVLLSGRGEEEAQMCEHIVQRAGIEWTVVRASWFNQNFSEGEFLDMVLAGQITLPAGDIAEPFVDVNDIADVAVAALTEDGHDGQVYELTGPRLLTFAEAVEEIASASGDVISDTFGFRRTHLLPVLLSQAHRMTLRGCWITCFPRYSTVGMRMCVMVSNERWDGEPTDFMDYARRIADAGLWKVAA